MRYRPPADLVAWARFAYLGWRHAAALAPNVALPLEPIRSLGVAPLLYRALCARQDPRAAVVAPDHRAAAARNLLTFGHVAAARDALAAAGVDAVLVKGGAFLVRYAPRDLGLRPAVDLDLLVGGHQFAAALSVLAAAGWRAVDLGHAHSAPAALAVTLVRADAPVQLDLHRELAQWPLLRHLPREVLDRRERCEGWAVPCRNDALLIAALHRARHGYALDGRDLVDALRLAEDLDEAAWSRLAGDARRLGLTGALHAILRQASWWFGESGTAGLDERLRALRGRLDPARRWLVERMSDVARVHSPSPFWARPLVRHLIVHPAALHAPGAALVAAGTYLPRRAWEEWTRSGGERSAGRRLRRVGRLLAFGSLEPPADDPGPAGGDSPSGTRGQRRDRREQ